MDFGTITLILLPLMMIYFSIQLYKFLLSLNPYDFTNKNQESYDIASTKKVKKILN
jgi:hypothetical protein